MKRIEQTAALLLLLATGYAALAASEGEMKDKSNGTLKIFLSIVPSIQINTVSNIHLDITDRRIDAQLSEPFCVVGNRAGRYRVVPHGSASPDDRFLLRNDDGDTLDYQVAFKGDPAGGFDPLSPGRQSPVYQLFTSEAACDDRSAFRITLLSEDLQSAGSGLYTGYLTLVVSPE